ncbi:MAG: type II toxin-antitoxin system PemK/MazF family toxin [Candidatus Paceibacterota bacterium]|jgi:mRNA interferase MazF
MSKDFKDWHIEKSDLHENKVRAFFHEREVWFASIGVNIGFEQDGKHEKFLRPIIVVKKFNNEVCWGIPTTKKNKKGKYYFSFEYKEGESTTVILSQLRLIDSKRLDYKIGSMKESDFTEMKKRLMSFLK